eukprot:TRINITY_DN13294_c0_g2_i1.p1 TRINITY_DN13294_c0_g2~~TRINITY_DN13294_c0_g2_i1.p1  ORF type:complete len:608 (+),score=98.39 TRINITY_DN13294_c0_g2_i1:86-1825(+)
MVRSGSLTPAPAVSTAPAGLTATPLATTAQRGSATPAVPRIAIGMHPAVQETQQQTWMSAARSMSAATLQRQSSPRTPRAPSESSVSAFTPRAPSEPPITLARNVVPVFTGTAQPQWMQMQRQHGAGWPGPQPYTRRSQVLSPQRIRLPSRSSTSRNEGSPDRDSSHLTASTTPAGPVHLTVSATPSLLPLAQRVRQSSPCERTERQPAAHEGPARSFLRASHGQDVRGTRQAPTALERLKATAAGLINPPSAWEATLEKGHGDKADEVLSALARLQKTLDEQQAEQKNRIAQLMAQWEERFSQVVQCLQSTRSSTTAVIKDRSADYVRLSEVLESSLDELGHNSQELAKLADRLEDLEASVDLIAQSSSSMQRAEGLLDEQDRQELQEVVRDDTAEEDGSVERSSEQEENGAEDSARRPKMKRKTLQSLNEARAGRLYSRRREADGGADFHSHLDAIGGKLRDLSNELGRLRVEVSGKSENLTLDTLELPAFAPLRAGPGQGGGTDWVTRQQHSDGLASSQTYPGFERDVTIRVAHPRVTAAGVLPPRPSGEDYIEAALSGDEDTVCGAGSPPRISMS